MCFKKKNRTVCLLTSITIGFVLFQCLQLAVLDGGPLLPFT